MSFIIVGIAILLFFVLCGFLIWTASDLPLALREIAINTRPERKVGSSYALLKVLSIIIKIFACLTWLGGIITSYLVSFSLLQAPLTLPFFS